MRQVVSRVRKVVPRNGQDGRRWRLNHDKRWRSSSTALPARCGLPFYQPPIDTDTAMNDPELLEITAPPSGDILILLLHSHRKFLHFLERRVGSREVAEEILQSSFAKAVAHADSLNSETVVAWFYRVLR